MISNPGIGATGHMTIQPLSSIGDHRFAEALPTSTLVLQFLNPCIYDKSCSLEVEVPSGKLTQITWHYIDK